MLVLLNSLCFIFILFWFITCDYFIKLTRYRVFVSKLGDGLKQAIGYNSSF